jgi:molybdopterin synthase catalytic subunit
MDFDYEGGKVRDLRRRMDQDPKFEGIVHRLLSGKRVSQLDYSYYESTIQKRRTR